MMPQAEMIDQLESEYIYAEIFRSFDVDSTGSVTQEDLFMAAECAGWKPE